MHRLPSAGPETGHSVPRGQVHDIVRSNSGVPGYRKGRHVKPWIRTKTTARLLENRTMALRAGEAFQQQSSFHAKELHTTPLGTNSSANTEIVRQRTESTNLERLDSQRLLHVSFVPSTLDSDATQQKVHYSRYSGGRFPHESYTMMARVRRPESRSVRSLTTNRK
jgi:hypothetical protein